MIQVHDTKTGNTYRPGDDISQLAAEVRMNRPAIDLMVDLHGNVYIRFKGGTVYCMTCRNKGRFIVSKAVTPYIPEEKVLVCVTKDDYKNNNFDTEMIVIECGEKTVKVKHHTWGNESVDLPYKHIRKTHG